MEEAYALATKRPQSGIEFCVPCCPRRYLKDDKHLAEDIDKMLQVRPEHLRMPYNPGAWHRASSSALRQAEQLMQPPNST